MSSSKAESAELILKLYDLRREATMREARNWIIGFMPESFEDLTKTMLDKEASVYFRQATSYWDMAASLVLHDAIDEQMFADANGEHIVIFSKIEPFLADIREKWGMPTYMKNLEALIMRMPDAKEMLEARRELMKRWMAARAEMANA